VVRAGEQTRAATVDHLVLPLTDVQFVLGHAQLSTTQLYLTHARRR
jgi:site-specific recombinase XerD